MRSVWTTIVLLAGLRAFAADPAAIADAHWQAHGAELLTEWAQVLAIPNHAQDGTNIQRNAEWLKQAFERRVRRVVLPEPLGPMRQTNSPGRMSRETPRKAGTASLPMR